MLYATVCTRSEAAQHPPGPMTLDPVPQTAWGGKSKAPGGLLRGVYHTNLVVIAPD